jgi:hypothetical protein
MLRKSGGGIWICRDSGFLKESRPSKKDVSFSDRTPSKFYKHTFYIILNLIYIIPGICCALMYINFFYGILKVYMPTGTIFGIILLIPWSIFYLMGLTFTILIHPLIQIILFFLVWKSKSISKVYIIIIFILSMIISLVYLYLLWGKGLILTV